MDQKTVFYQLLEQHINSVYTCKQCNERRPAKNPPSGRPMIALGFLTRVQMDLIDFSSRPDGDYRYILHVRDHFSKYSWAFPLTSKRASEVAEKIVELFCTFGPAKFSSQTMAENSLHL